MGTKIYNETVTLDKELERRLIEVYAKHLDIYNDCLKMLKSDPTVDFSKLRTVVRLRLLDEPPGTYIEDCILNEIYYMEKQHRDREIAFRTLDGVNYLTLRVSSYNNNVTKYNPEEKTLELKGFPGVIRLPKALPYSPGVYLNISYSGRRKNFTVSVFE